MNTKTSMLFFFSGWPACGETHYGEWLAEMHGFRHVNLDDDGSEDEAWTDLWQQPRPARARAVASRLIKMHPRWVLTARAPLGDLERLEALQSAGFTLWFFLARREELSRQRWMMLEREIDPDARPLEWKQRADAIRKSARGLRPYFRDRCIETLTGGCELIDAESLAAQLGLPGTPELV